LRRSWQLIFSFTLPFFVCESPAFAMASVTALLPLAASHSQTGWIAFAGFFTLGADWTALGKITVIKRGLIIYANDHQGHVVPLRTAIGKGRDSSKMRPMICAGAMIAALQSLRSINICTTRIDLSGMSSFEWSDSHHGQNIVIS
jgi:hypothetical protein